MPTPKSKRITSKCAARGCKHKVHRLPIHIKTGKYRFCSPKCARNARKVPKYDKAGIKWIKENIGVLSYAEMATHFNTGLKAFTKALHTLRDKGHKIPKLRPASDTTPKPIGTRHVTHRANGDERIMEKTSTGWKDVTLKVRGKKERQKPAEDQPKKKKHSAKSEVVIIPVPVETVAKTRIELPGGTFILCDSDKVEATLKYLSKQKIA